MKLYVHVELNGAPYTQAVESGDFTTLQELIEAVVKGANEVRNLSSSLDVACVELSTIQGERLLRYGDTIKRCCEYIALSDCNDLLLVECMRRTVPAKAASSSTSASAPTKAATSSSSAATPTTSTKSDVDMDTTALIKKAVTVAQRYMEKAYYKKARETALECLKALSKKKVKDCSLNELTCEILMAAKKYEEAVDYAEKAVEIATSLSMGDNRTGSTKRYLYFLLARAHFEAGNFEDAFAILKKCTDELGGKTAKGSATATMVTAECAKASQKPYVKGGKVHYPWLHLDIAALRAETLFAIGRHIEAADVVNSCMGDANCEKHMGVLLAYSSFAAQYGKIQEAMRSLLKVVVLDQTERKGRRLLSTLLNSENGIKEVQQQLPVGTKSSSAYGLLAMIAKDHSAIPASKAMLEFALGGDPTNVGYLLNLMHVIELQGPGKYAEALTCCESFLAVHGGMVRVGASNGGGFSSADLLAAMRGEDHNKASGRVTSADQVSLVVDWVPGDGEYESPRPDEDDEAAAARRVYGYARVLPLCQDPTSKAYYLGDEEEEEKSGDKVDEDSKQLYDNTSLDLLAVAFTIVKLLYLQGRFDRLPAVYRCVERSRMMSRQPLHETTIHNEHAYYQCIAQVLAYRLSCIDAAKKVKSGCGAGITHAFPALPHLASPAFVCPDLSKEGLARLTQGKRERGIREEEEDGDDAAVTTYLKAAKNPLYVVGDSHVVPLAFTVLLVGGIPRLLLPRLTTGIKHYHLRADSDFYPKYQFSSNLKSIPDNSDIMFVLGEIDCREGLLVAVEKDQYSSLSSGMHTTLKHFIDVLPPLFKQRKMGHVYVHPVLPILPETRAIVKQYNAFYEQACGQAAGKVIDKASKERGSSLHWLPFFEKLFQGGVEATQAATPGDHQEGSLLQGLGMDGTHISPGYAHLLQAAFP